MSGDVEFRVFKDKGIVVCRLLNCFDIAQNRIEKYTHIAFTAWADKYLIPNVFVGVAKCAPEDTFDEEIGKKVALTKAKARRCKAVNNMIKKFIEDEKRDLEVLTTYGIHQIPDVKELGY